MCINAHVFECACLNLCVCVCVRLCVSLCVSDCECVGVMCICECVTHSHVHGQENDGHTAFVDL